MNGLHRHASTGAALAAFLAALWVLQYVVTTGYGSPLYRTSLLSYVLGQAYDLGSSAETLLTVIVARFVLAFGATWLPLTALLAALTRRSEAVHEPSDFEPGDAPEEGESPEAQAD
jgi:hypothetical protein